ncbi:hypothetical protein BH20ACI3_BH20ACI3_36560 [soil metagenome]
MRIEEKRKFLESASAIVKLVKHRVQFGEWRGQFSGDKPLSDPGDGLHLTELKKYSS